MHDDGRGEPGRQDRRPAQLAQVDARRPGDERRRADLHAARGRRRAAHGPLRHARDGRAHAAGASRRRGGLHRLADLLRRGRRPRSDRGDRPRRRQAAAWSTRPGDRTFTSIRRCRSRRPAPAPISASTRRTRCSRPSRSARCSTRRASACASTGSRPWSRCFSRPRRICRWSPRSTSRANRWRPRARRCSTRTIELARETRERLNQIPGIYCFGEELQGKKGVFDLDPTKITVTVKDLGYTGYEASEILRRRYNIQVELADLFNVVALFTIGTTRDAADRLVTAFGEMARDDRALDMFAPSGMLEQRLRRGTFHLPPVPPMRMIAARRVSGRDRVREVSRVERAHLRGDV